MTTVRLRRIAKRDLREAAAWYRERSEDVSRRFLAEVERTLALLAQVPSTGAFVPGVEERSIRRLPVHNFPYHVVFITLPRGIAVLAIAHDRRRPGYWND
jgi:plasmid stabilization system protein ParE